MTVLLAIVIQTHSWLDSLPRVGQLAASQIHRVNTFGAKSPAKRTAGHWIQQSQAVCFCPREDDHVEKTEAIVKGCLEKHWNPQLGTMAHACNPNYSGS